MNDELAKRLDREWLALNSQEADLPQLQHDLLKLFALGPIEIERIRDEVARLRAEVGRTQLPENSTSTK